MKKTAKKSNAEKTAKISIFELETKDLQVISGGRGVIVNRPQPGLQMKP